MAPRILKKLKDPDLMVDLTFLADPTGKDSKHGRAHNIDVRKAQVF